MTPTKVGKVMDITKNLFDMTEEDFASAATIAIGFRLHQICEHYTKDELMKERSIFVFYMGSIMEKSPFQPIAALECGIFFEKRGEEPVSWIDFELFGHLYNHGYHDKEFKQKIDRFKEIGQKIFMDNDKLTKLDIIKVEKEIQNDTD